MAMFDTKPTERVTRTAAGPGTVIGGNVKLVGALRDASDITIHGSVEGEVASERMVTIGETAQIKGPVSGATVSVAGVIRGSVEAGQRLEILPSGKVFGDINVKDLIIRSGATFVGKCTMAEDRVAGNDEEGSIDTDQESDDSNISQSTETSNDTAKQAHSATNPRYEVE